MKKTKGISYWNSREIRIATSVIIAVVLAMIVIGPWRNDIEEEIAPQDITLHRRAIDGVFVQEEKVNLPIVGVMVENMAEAQPISGIANSPLVFEVLTEANITRFLAYFILDHDNVIEKIGPVRSARPYYLDFASAFNTLYAHVGSSPAAYNMLRKEGVSGVYDLDQWYKSEYFWRSDDRYSPHNVYTSSALLLDAYEEKFSDENEGYKVWEYKKDITSNLKGDVDDIKIGYVEPYNVQWLYDKEENQYKRMQWDGSHKDDQGNEIKVKNVVVAFQRMEVLDNIGRKSFETIGQGKGMVFQDGKVTVGTWEKPSKQERIRWYDIYDNEIKFNAGNTWVHIVPDRYKVEY